MSRAYLIWVPPLSGSAGIRGLYKLAESLREHGQSVKLWSWGDIRQPGFDYAERLTPQMQENDVVVYPEIVTGNPLQIRNVVRWVLFFPGKLGGESCYHPSEKIFTWSEEYYPGVPKLTVDIIDRKLFFDAGLPRTQDCTFVHKKDKWKEIPELDGLTEITMQWPETREELARLLQTTKTLYSWDGYSALNDEAYCCGAEVKIITEEGFRDFSSNATPDPAVFEQELEFFISETQSMNYTGKLQPLHPRHESRFQRMNCRQHVFHFLFSVIPLPFFQRKEKLYRDRLRRLGCRKQRC